MIFLHVCVTLAAGKCVSFTVLKRAWNLVGGASLCMNTEAICSQTGHETKTMQNLSLAADLFSKILDDLYSVDLPNSSEGTGEAQTSWHSMIQDVQV